ncbi:MAG: ECF transporter S component [Brotaphodocola sp.]
MKTKIVQGSEMVLEKEEAGSRMMVLAAMFLALGMIMPFLTGQIPGIGSRLLPMHIPVLICGFVCGWKYGLLVGFIVPILRSALFGMPPMMPTAAAMAFELAAYGAVTGGLYTFVSRRKASGVGAVYTALIGAMLVGRLVWGLVSIPLYGMVGNAFSISMFAAGAFLNAVPGIILQLVMIPMIVMALKRAKMME